MIHLSLRSRLMLWSSLLALTTLTAVIALVDFSFRSNIRQDLEEDLTFARRVAEDARSRHMADRISETVQMAMDTRLAAAVETRDPATVRETLIEVVPRGRSGWSAALDPTGALLAATPGTPVDQLRNSRELIDEAFYYDTGDLWADGGALIEVAASAILFGTTPLGVLITGQALDQKGLSALEDATGRAVAVRVGDRLTLGGGAEALPPAARIDLERHLEDPEAQVSVVTLGAEKFFAAALPLTSGRGQIMGTLALLGSYDEALAPSRRLRAEIAVIFVMVLLLTAGAGALFFRGITVPVQHLLRDTKRLARGDLEQTIAPLRHDEIGQLAIAFEKMRVSLRTAREELIRSERLSAIGQAASAVAHDFAQPLTVILGAAGMLEHDVDDPVHREQCFRAIDRELSRLRRMKQEILDFAHGRAELDLAPTPVDGFIESVLTPLRAELEKKGVHLQISHGYAGEWSLDAFRLGRVIENLIRNAATAFDGGGAIRVRTGEFADALRIEVEDDGPGIPAEILDRLFEPFVSHGKKDGTGLGLAIAKSVVEQHGGHIGVTSGREGTCFSIELPGETRGRDPLHQESGSPERIAQEAMA